MHPLLRTAAHNARLPLLALGLAAGTLLPQTARAAFGVTSSGGNYVVDTGGGLVFKIGQSSGDMNSLVYDGKQLQSQTDFSHINSGFGTATVSASVVNTDYIRVTVLNSDSTIKHYYLVRRGDNVIYMQTYISEAQRELRYIARLSTSTLPNAPTPSDIRNNTGKIGAEVDVFKLSSGQTRSKYYGRDQAKNLDATLTGATGSGVGVFMVHGNREKSSGGPFFRDLQHQTGDQNEVYNYMFSGHAQTESARIGLHGPYALVVTDGSTPAASSVDFSWINGAGLGLTGYTYASGRGRIVLNGISGRDSSFTYTVRYGNATAQYWGTASSSDGSCTVSGMIPGTYNMNIYKGELSVYSATGIVVSAGDATTLSTRTVTDPDDTSVVWRIGNWDGTPKSFLNATNLINMHPSDTRMSDWTPQTFTIGTTTTGYFPSCQWQGADVSGPITIRFNLTSSQVTSHTVRLGICIAYESGRPRIKINDWTGPSQAASTQPDSRSLTLGTYRGNNFTYTVNVPASAFVSGTNTMTIDVISGSGNPTGYLSAGVAYDCVELD